MPHSHADQAQKRATQLNSIITSHARQYITRELAGGPTIMEDLFPDEIQGGLSVILAELKSHAEPMSEQYAQKLAHIEALKAGGEELSEQLQEARRQSPDPADIQACEKQIQRNRTLAHKLRRKTLQWASACGLSGLFDFLLTVAVFNALDVGGGPVTTLISWALGLSVMFLLGGTADWGILRALQAARENAHRPTYERILSWVSLVILVAVSFGLAKSRTEVLGVEGSSAWVMLLVTALSLPIVALLGAYCWKTAFASEAERRLVVQEIDIKQDELDGLLSYQPQIVKVKKLLPRNEKDVASAQRELVKWLDSQVTALMTASVRQGVRDLADEWATLGRPPVGAARAIRAASNDNHSKSVELNGNRSKSVEVDK